MTDFDPNTKSPLSPQTMSLNSLSLRTMSPNSLSIRTCRQLRLSRDHVAKIHLSLVIVAIMLHHRLMRLSSCFPLNLVRNIFRFVAIGVSIEILQRKQTRCCFLVKVQVMRQENNGLLNTIISSTKWNIFYQFIKPTALKTYIGQINDFPEKNRKNA